MNSRNISDEERQQIFDRGVFKTIVRKDPVYEEHDVTVIALESVGTKYIHGLVCHKDDSGKVEPNYWIGSYDKKTVKVFDGQRWDLVDQSRIYATQRREHITKRNDTERQILYECERKAREECYAQMAKWDLENPRPKDPLDSLDST